MFLVLCYLRCLRVGNSVNLSIMLFSLFALLHAFMVRISGLLVFVKFMFRLLFRNEYE